MDDKTAHTITVILWVDAFSDDEDKHADELSPGMPLMASGILIKEDKESLYFGFDYCGSTDTWRGCSVIPKSLVRARADIPVPGRVLKAWEKARKRYE